MSDTEQPDPQAGFALGDLSAGEFDTSLGQPEPAEEPDPIEELPRTALLAFRKSGGMRFSTRGIVVYRDGWVVPEGEVTWRHHLGAYELARLAHLALRARLGRSASAGGPQPPDGYAYQIAARLGRHIRRAEVMTGAIPPEIAPLIRALERIMNK